MKDTKNKKMKGIFPVLLFCLLIGGGSFLQPLHGNPAKKEVNRLSKKYLDWLNLVSYIITRAERTTFFKLTNDRDRDMFISLFWNMRDPSPGTDENEFKEEHIRRFQYAQKYFKYGTPREGWRTDMGRIYIILGEPSSRNRFESDSSIYPAQVWSYYGIKRPGLPPAFWIVFVQEQGLGEYRIYDPSVDGPGQLVKRGKGTEGVEINDIQGNYEVLEQAHPELAKASLSLIPNESVGFAPSLRSRELLNSVMVSPTRKINDSYATNFLKYRGVVDVDYSINYIESLHKTMVLKNPETGLDFVHFALRPKSLSSAALGETDTYSFNFDLTVSLTKKTDRRGETGETVFEYRKRFPFSGTGEEMMRHFYNGMIISDCFPVVEGEYRLAVLLQNRVNKEFTYFDTDISVPAGAPPHPVLKGVLVTKELKALNRRAFLPFRFRDMEITLDPRNTFGTKDNIYVVFSLDRGKTKKEPVKGVVEVHDFFDPGKYKKSYPFEIAADEKRRAFSRELEPMIPGYYGVTVRLVPDEGKPVEEKTETFTVTVSAHVPDTTQLFRAVPLENGFLYYHILGIQYQRLNKLEKAEAFMEKAFAMKPGYPVLVKDLCMLLLRMKKIDRVFRVVESLKAVEKFRFDYFAIKGKALFQNGQYVEAAESLAEANRIYDSDITVLNTLGFAYIKTGNIAEAKKALAASLRLDDRQETIARALEELK